MREAHQAMTGLGDEQHPPPSVPAPTPAAEMPVAGASGPGKDAGKVALFALGLAQEVGGNIKSVPGGFDVLDAEGNSIAHVPFMGETIVMPDMPLDQATSPVGAGVGSARDGSPQLEGGDVGAGSPTGFASKTLWTLKEGSGESDSASQSSGSGAKSSISDSITWSSLPNSNCSTPRVGMNAASGTLGSARPVWGVADGRPFNPREHGPNVIDPYPHGHPLRHDDTEERENEVIPNFYQELMEDANAQAEARSVWREYQKNLKKPRYQRTDAPPSTAAQTSTADMPMKEGAPPVDEVGVHDSISQAGQADESAGSGPIAPGRGTGDISGTPAERGLETSATPGEGVRSYTPPLPVQGGTPTAPRPPNVYHDSPQGPEAPQAVTEPQSPQSVDIKGADYHVLGGHARRPRKIREYGLVFSMEAITRVSMFIHDPLEERILLIQEDGRWGVAGGRVETDDGGLDGTVRREVEEELGIPSAEISEHLEDVVAVFKSGRTMFYVVNAPGFAGVWKEHGQQWLDGRKEAERRKIPRAAWVSFEGLSTLDTHDVYASVFPIVRNILTPVGPGTVAEDAPEPPPKEEHDKEAESVVDPNDTERGDRVKPALAFGPNERVRGFVDGGSATPDVSTGPVRGGDDQMGSGIEATAEKLKGHAPSPHGCDPCERDGRAPRTEKEKGNEKPQTTTISVFPISKSNPTFDEIAEKISIEKGESITNIDVIAVGGSGGAQRLALVHHSAHAPGRKCTTCGEFIMPMGAHDLPGTSTSVKAESSPRSGICVDCRPLGASVKALAEETSREAQKAATAGDRGSTGGEAGGSATADSTTVSQGAPSDRPSAVDTGVAELEKVSEEVEIVDADGVLSGAQSRAEALSRVASPAERAFGHSPKCDCSSCTKWRESVVGMVDEVSKKDGYAQVEPSSVASAIQQAEYSALSASLAQSALREAKGIQGVVDALLKTTEDMPHEERLLIWECAQSMFNTVTDEQGVPINAYVDALREMQFEQEPDVDVRTRRVKGRQIVEAWLAIISRRIGDEAGGPDPSRLAMRGEGGGRLSAREAEKEPSPQRSKELAFEHGGWLTESTLDHHTKAIESANLGGGQQRSRGPSTASP